MNLNEIKTYVKGLENFAFETITSAKAAEIVYGNNNKAHIEEFTKPGLYRVSMGPRGIVEHIEVVGSSVDSLDLPTLDEVIESNPDFFEDEDGESGSAVAKMYFEDFYMIVEDAENAGVLNFGFTEEEFDYYFMVG